MLPSIQALRALAVFMVVLVHLPALAVMAGGPSDMFAFGHAGVDLFFVISGLIMTRTTSQRKATPWGFFAHRLSRVVPLYWLITMAVFGVAFFAPWLLQATRADPVQLIKSLLFIPFQKANGQIAPIVFVGWTLNYEMIFYAIFGLTLFFNNPRIAAAITCAVLIFATTLPFDGFATNLAVGFYTKPIVLEFSLGIILGLLLPYLPGKTYMRWPAAVSGLLALGLIVCSPWMLPGHDRVIQFGIPAFVIVLSALILDTTKIEVPASLVLLGDASYAIYLTHFFVTQAVIRFAAGLPWHNVVWSIIEFIFAIFGIVAVGLLTHYWIERPLSGRARRFLSHGEPRPRAESVLSEA